MAITVNDAIHPPYAYGLIKNRKSTWHVVPYLNSSQYVLPGYTIPGVATGVFILKNSGLARVPPDQIKKALLDEKSKGEIVGVVELYNDGVNRYKVGYVGKVTPNIAQLVTEFLGRSIREGNTLLATNVGDSDMMKLVLPKMKLSGYNLVKNPQVSYRSPFISIT